MITSSNQNNLKKEKRTHPCPSQEGNWSCGIKYEERISPGVNPRVDLHFLSH